MDGLAKLDTLLVVEKKICQRPFGMPSEIPCALSVCKSKPVSSV